MENDNRQAPRPITYHRLALEDIISLDHFWQDEVRVAIEQKLVTRPELFSKPLQYVLKGCRTLHVGDYRVVFKIISNTVHVVAIIHRSSDYKEVERRL
ncbi:hypothetical protein A2673_00225 [Candidatus Kaiserbacteria bacterium RIFCSPHIGHO2_01_FULL_50_13]|uniref:Addiction module toxin RelE n=1 Tax=Candidatus Kaiserbacteria bacterium RIFCSPLOWO2_01_FULL_50_24 TaxID=1798507 RepID=A0A1F6EJ02_9BACT|nr:MAG: hypothetical protein A2673_00225 [Candidatus Kaiserbacteria bacterium RIFCSPHIGHO2_01_FULL_50_13]OGG73607.1 MAG: hypothetical protein A3A34_02945 [Candidatus Kaiserbacteria bacterium RIFCSPLOWO2_01_FULL_50_24]OGG81269.1 MAG: hypothetical protein A3H74_03805 [Candidatus Kaiserbacteria bacterium RIFCSPLOWO2_02_FULL_51_13]